MSGWDGHSSGSGPEHEPSEERGRAAWAAEEPDAEVPVGEVPGARAPDAGADGAGTGGAVPPWVSAETRTAPAPPAGPAPTPPPWASAQTQTAHVPPPWATATPHPRPAPSAESATPPQGSGTPPGTPPWGSPGAWQTAGTPPWNAAGLPHPSTTPPWGSAGTPPAGPATGGPPRAGWAAPQTSSAYAPAPGASAGPGTAGHRVGRLLAALAVTAVVGGGVGAGVWYVARDHGGSGTGAAPAVDAGVTGPAADSAPPGSTPAASPPQESEPPGSPFLAPSAPAGYRRAQDPVGYTVDVPEGWSRRQKQGEKAPVVYYDAPGDGRQLQIFAIAEDTPAASLDLAENHPGYGFARQPGYQALDRGAAATWSELTYRYDDPDKGARRVIDHRFQAPDGTLYAIRVSGPEAMAPDLISTPLTTALASFCPSGGSCG
ncbi:hypothetical protein ACF1A5_01780 [Streptomyces sp. NPDC014864]|uniref:hypothetical protein n=1 Tax=Streptomyces sp. NPDC014864 TaxID=3364924 RepID=UPI0036F874D0